MKIIEIIFSAKERKLLMLWMVILLASCQENKNRKEIPEIEKLKNAVLHKEEFRQKKENQLHIQKELLKSAKTLEQRYQINQKIIELYSGFQSDSAFVYISRNLALAKKSGQQEWKYETLITESRLLSATGLFVEAKSILDSIRPNVPESRIFNYNSAEEGLYNNLYDYSNRNREFADVYRKKLLQYYNRGNGEELDPVFGNLFLYNKYRLEGNWVAAKKSIDGFIEHIREDRNLSENFSAIAYYCKANVEKNLGNTALQEKYLALSSIQDIQRATTENGSMQELSYLLYQKKEYDLAYLFLNSAMDDAVFYNARFRSFQISQLQPIIGKAYNDQINRSNDRLKIALTIISLMIFLLAVVIYLLIKNLREVNRARKNLKTVNAKLHEANRIKEEYVAFFVQQSSLYLEKFEQYKKQISLRVATGQLKKLEEMLKGKKGDIINLNEFYQNFDNAFLRIYPNFVKEINTFLKPEDRFTLKPGILNNELRIFALIRLGINDTQQISGFLRYTVQTIYNYKSKVKQKMVIPSDDFESKIMKIGAI